MRPIVRSVRLQGGCVNVTSESGRPQRCLGHSIEERANGGAVDVEVCLVTLAVLFGLVGFETKDAGAFAAAKAAKESALDQARDHPSSKS